ncbi:Ephrin type-A receptor 10 [Holothuria leucospilota]|uniref:Ephrin type-A receptor 10 n=1 Tax=Holothuria leucospilota TaxID=206669 RepID=A0A9Q1C5W8_HOLLE|nr:Ephrin type-A receptor 10 [Holothuria leucospilota]
MRAVPTEQYSTDLYLTPIDRSTGVFSSLGDTQITCEAAIHEGFPQPPNLSLPEIPGAAIPDYCDPKLAGMYSDTIDNPFKLLENSSRRKKPKLPPKNTQKEKTHGLPPDLPLPEIPPEKIAEYSEEETENYYATTEQTTTRGRVFHEKDMCSILEIKTGKLYIRWMGTIAVTTGANKCVIMTTVTDAVLNSKDIQWDAFVKRALELPKSSNISKIEGIGVLKGKIHLIHEYLVYGTLDDRIKSAESITESRETLIPLSPSEMMRHLLGILEGMELIHSYGFLHPGLSTKKILLSNQGICKLYDFCLSEDAAKIINFRRAKAISSENQLAPEVNLRSEYSSASDVWAAAVVIWEMISYGVPPFPSPNDTIYGIKLKPPSPSKLPKDYKHMSKTCLFECWNRKESSRPTINQLRLSCVKVIKSQVDTYNIPEIYLGSTKTECYVPMKKEKNGDKS